jgi:Protein of unknown function (DUF1524)
MIKHLFLLLFFALFSFSACSSRYQRKHWHHWIDEDRDCQNTRQEILISRSLEPVKFNPMGCVVYKGKWQDYYFDEVLIDSRTVDIDHLIPLKHAHDSGGSDWSSEKKMRFANDPENLVITNKKYNRMKGAKTIAQWLPVDPSYTCKYVNDWIKIKNKYELTLSKDENLTIETLRGKCHK